MEKALLHGTKLNNFLIFNGNLVHGSGSNKGKTIRFSITFGLIEKKKFIEPQNFVSFRSSKPTFTTPTFAKADN